MATLESIADRFWSKVDKDGPIKRDGFSPCWIWIRGLLPEGYGAFYWNGQNRKAHRVSWMLAHGEIPAGLYVTHQCDFKPCVNPEHLRLGTAADNSRDAVERGQYPSGDRNWQRKYPERRRRGEANPYSKLTEASVLEILRSDLPAVVLARSMGVVPGTIQGIRSRRSWTHVTLPEE